MRLNLYENFCIEDKANRILIQSQDETVLTYKQLDERVSQYCHFLKGINLNPGDRVIHKTSKSVEALCLYLSVIRYGCIYVPLNPDFTFNETIYFIEDAEPALFVCEAEGLLEISAYIDKQNIKCAVYTLNKEGTGSIQSAIQKYPTNFSPIIHSNDIACILYTSGTTGKPKGAMLSHHNLLSNARALVDLWAITPSDILLHMLPIFHCHGLFFACHTILLAGAQMFFLPKFDIDVAIQFLAKSTIFMGVPTYYARLLCDRRLNETLAKNTRLFISGSAPLLERNFLDFKSRTGKAILERYGMTETGINTSNPLEGERIPGSVGRPLSNVKLRITDNHDRNIDVNEIGHIQVKGDSIFAGYWKKQEQRKHYFTEDGYFRTGDIGIIRENGYLYILDRANDLIISGGMNVYPKEIENIIDQIKGVTESAVIGLPNPDFGEVVIAIVVKEKNSTLCAETILNEIKLNLANYKQPKKIFFLDELPRNSMGKIQKKVLREKFIEQQVLHDY